MFSTERELVDFFIQHSEKCNKFYVQELPTNFGRPDIVELIIDAELLEERKMNNENTKLSIQRIDTYITSYLVGKSWVKLSTISKFLNVNVGIINSSLNRLSERKMLEIDETNNLVKLKRKKELLVIKSLTPFEAKLTNWKYVIEQAERHLWFSNQSYILIPELSVNIQEKAESLARSRGVGVSIANQNKIFYKTKKQIGKLINTPLLWELNEGIVDGRIKLSGRKTIERSD